MVFFFILAAADDDDAIVRAFNAFDVGTGKIDGDR